MVSLPCIYSFRKLPLLPLPLLNSDCFLHMDILVRFTFNKCMCVLRKPLDSLELEPVLAPG